MGAVSEISKRVSLELRRDSFVLYIGDDTDLANVTRVEIGYDDATDVLQAVDQARTSDRFNEHMKSKGKQ